ncbi:N-acetylglucosamine kinase [Piscibacillus salipiscarius]|uniref:N-acetylglucosamine kinase n=1 Tax=Piscibacillus salipiscarius TaxID=299480 RepID=A0ABW5QAJ7_9BACI|nr:ROK family protein [Piscibacillus salipiscarius]
MTYVIGIDGGGTKTKAILADEFGNVYASVTTGPSNPNAMMKEELAETINYIFNELEKQALKQFNACKLCFAGMSGIGETKNYNLLKGLFACQCENSQMQVVMNNDAINALYAGTLGEDGIVHISGTGSITLSLFNNKIDRVGGWGYLFDDLGSGFAIGEASLAAVFQSFDGRGSVTSLTPRLLKHFNCEEVPELVKVIYNAPNHRVKVAEISPLTFECAADGDSIANEIIHSISKDIAHSINTLIKSRNKEAETITVILSGGIFKRADIMIPKLKEHIKYPVSLETIKVEPVFGAVIAALNELGVKRDDEFVNRINEQY